MYKAFKFRMYPTIEQEKIINMNLDNKRFIYNYYLDKAKNSNQVNTKQNIYDYNKKLKLSNQFLQTLDMNIVYKTLYSIEETYKKINNLETMKFKSKYNRNSYTTLFNKNINNPNIILDLKRRTITLPNLENVKIKGYKKLKEIKGRIINATISKEPTVNYYVSVSYEIQNVNAITNPKNIVGIDLGIKELLTLSDGTTIDNIHAQEKFEKRIKRKQKELSRKIKGSKNYYKCKKELAILYNKLTNLRKSYIHKITKDITNEYDIITCEKLKTEEMIIKGKNSNLSSKLIDTTFAEILRQLSYKAKFKGKRFYQINSYYPSSQVCSRCDNQDKTYKDLSKREYICKKCGQVLDRDLNASINIMFEGLKLYMKNYAK